MELSMAIVVVAYNRDKSLGRLLESLNSAYIDKGTRLIISIDRSNNQNVRKVARKFEWAYGEKEIICHEENLGLRKHILKCGRFLDVYEAIIILEDDLIVSKNFFKFAKQAVSKYYNEKKIAGISLYSFGVNYQTFYPFIPQPSEFDTYFIKCAQSWGQVWMKNQWKDFEKWYSNHNDDMFDKNILPGSICSWSSKSWLKYHTRYCIEENKYFVYPYDSFSSNCGEIGTHLKFSSPVFQRPLAEMLQSYIYKFPDLTEDSVKYDGFFEAERIYNKLGINEADLCIDLTNSKKYYGNKHYILTTKRLGFEVVKNYGIAFTPIELNVINDCPGNMICLYDTTKSSKKPSELPPVSKRVLYAYENNVDLFAVIRRLWQYGVINIIKTLIKAL